MSPRARSAANEGIHANTVTADVLAVGRGARAEKTVIANGDQRALLDAIAALRAGIDRLQLPAAVTRPIAEDVAALERESQQKASSPEAAAGRITSIMTKLKAAGVVISDVATLVEPIGKIVSLLRIAVAGF